MKAADLLARLRRLANRNGWDMTERKGKGSHIVVRLNGNSTVVSNHRGDMATGTFRKILKDLVLTETDLEV
ncbi:type II toxin-antitoxin system HicA family toxin [Gluconacetobacter entanii]|uniref:type II toxin-antitoxin system HicA family toxin n=1 Tax=Gluconacetobacter entanii TaxID=108528 RepID=UPI0021BC0437|nr:type II toxin-antitoxin system HicA family toxin [Gluconacetobacter entanii]MCW4579446.1 type II toxin-antitoxin system HicA family toxin [Gluconacetobacter entanii]MCW4582807.1 type II toxin-antitoxin system HicA family toxin [Gluconacetobacter entanii]MCW4586248.1 type II toxin-antitoxin system HicA family toxin [Gluconacetobacter entanii]